MKRNILLFILIIVTLAIACFRSGCQSKDSGEGFQSDPKEYEFIIDRKTCKRVFQSYPENAEVSLNKSSWANDNYRSASVDEDGNLKIVLSGDDINEWNKHIDSLISKASTPYKEGSDSFVVNETFDRIVIYTTKDNYINLMFQMALVANCCDLHLLLNGVSSNELSVDIEVYDTITGDLVKKGVIDKDNAFSLSAFDWEPKSQDTEEVFSVQEYTKDIIDEIPSFNDFSDDSYEDFETVFPKVESAKLYSGGRYADISENDPRLFKLLNYILNSYNEKTTSVRIGQIKREKVEEWYLDDTKMIEIYFDLPESNASFDENDLSTVKKILIRDDSWILVENPGTGPFGAGDTATYQFWPYGSLWDFQTFSDQIMNGDKANIWLGMLTNLSF